MPTKFVTFIIAGLLFGLLVSSVPVFAQDAAETAATPAAQDEPPKLGIRPIGVEGPYFDIELNPGKKMELTIELGNFGGRAESALTFAVDVTTGINGGMEIGTSDQPITGTTEWLDYRTETLELEVGERVERTFTIAVPTKTKPGQYLTSLVIQTALPVDVNNGGDSNFSVNQIIRQAIAVAITVPGEEQPELTINNASYWFVPGSVSVRVAVANTGNIHLRPVAELVVNKPDGQVVGRASISLDTVYAGTETLVEASLLQPLQPGDYIVSLSLIDDEHHIDAKDHSLPMTVENLDANGTPIAEAAAIAIESVVVNELRDQSTNTLQGVELVVGIDNPAPQIANARLTLHVTQDGQPVEDFVLGSSLTYPTGKHEFRQRYLPMTGWAPGVWSFSVTLDVVDPVTGTVIELSTFASTTSVTAP